MAMSLEQAYEKHNNHDIKIIWKYIKGYYPDYRKPALVCKDCNKQIQWLNDELANSLITEFNIPEEGRVKRPLTWAEKRRQQYESSNSI